MTCSKPNSEPLVNHSKQSFCADRRKNSVRGPLNLPSEPLHVTAALLSLLIEWFHRESIPRLRLLITASSSTSQRHAPSSFAPLSNATANTRPSSPHVTPCLSLCDKPTTLFHHRSPPELHLTFEIDTRVPFHITAALLVRPPQIPLGCHEFQSERLHFVSKSDTP